MTAVAFALLGAGVVGGFLLIAATLGGFTFSRLDRAAPAPAPPPPPPAPRKCAACGRPVAPPPPAYEAHIHWHYSGASGSTPVPCCSIECAREIVRRGS